MSSDGKICASAQRFINSAVLKGFEQRRAENAWKFMVEVTKGARYKRELALQEALTPSEQHRVLNGGPSYIDQRRFARPEIWTVIKRVHP